MALNQMRVQSKPNRAPPVQHHLHFALMKVHEQKLITVLQFITTDCSEQTVVPYCGLIVFILSAFICHLGGILYFSLLLHLTPASLIETLA